MDRKTADYETFLLEYCDKITAVLFEHSVRRQLSADDEELINKINVYKDIDDYTSSLKSKTDVEVYIYTTCTRFFHYENSKPTPFFDIGAEMDAFEGYFDLLRDGYMKKYKENLPCVLINIKDLIVSKLSDMDIATKIGEISVKQKRSFRNQIYSVERKLQDLNKEAENFEKDIASLSKSVGEVSAKNSDIYKDIISIVSIFAAVVLTMAGVFSFTSSVLDNICKANIWSLLLIVLVFGIIFVTTFVGMFYFLYNVRHDIESYLFRHKNNNFTNDVMSRRERRLRYSSSEVSISNEPTKEDELIKRIKKHRNLLLTPFFVALAILVIAIISIILIVILNENISVNGKAVDSVSCTCEICDTSDSSSSEDTSLKETESSSCSTSATPD